MKRRKMKIKIKKDTILDMHRKVKNEKNTRIKRRKKKRTVTKDDVVVEADTKPEEEVSKSKRKEVHKDVIKELKYRKWKKKREKKTPEKIEEEKVFTEKRGESVSKAIRETGLGSYVPKQITINTNKQTEK